MADRWREVLELVAGAVTAAPATVVVDGTDAQVVATTTERLTATLRAAGAIPGATPGDDGIAIGGGSGAIRGDAVGATGGGIAFKGGGGAVRGGDVGAIGGGGIAIGGGGPRVVVWLRTSRRRHADEAARGDAADIVVDLHDPAWPVVRHVNPRLLEPGRWYVRESRAFFAVRAATWDAKFGDDLPAYAAAVRRAALPAGGTVLDAGCGTGRALPALRAAVGPAGIVLGLDLTPQMLEVARARGERLIMADTLRLPFAAATLDAVFAAGLIMHLPDAAGGLGELARVTVPGGRLVLFHPTGRATLAARHGRVLRPDEPLSPAPLTASCERAGWELADYDDGAEQFYALAVRRGEIRTESIDEAGREK